METPKHGRKENRKKKCRKQMLWVFSLLSDEVKEPFEALSLYHSKDIVE